MAARMARRRYGTKVLYTAHGLHFYKGAPLINWLLFYPVEKILSRYTDAIITINSEDFELVKKKFKTGFIYKIDGIGVDSSKFDLISEDDRACLRKVKSYKSDDFILIYAAEFIYRKNHKFVLDAIKFIAEEIPSLKILFAGRGVLMQDLRKYAKKIKVDQFVDFLGFRTDINDLIRMSDVGISASKSEGLGLNLAEEMFCGIPVIAASDRGHKELVEHGVNGFLFEQNNHKQFAHQVIRLYCDEALREKVVSNALLSVQKFSIENSLHTMEKIYGNYI